jgi:carboxymethylenebutenolidase
MFQPDHESDLHALVPGQTSEQGPSRRTALKAAVGVGYAAATLPVMAQTAVKTSAEGLVAGDVTIDVNGFKMPAYRAAPAGKTNLPVVLVLSEIFGVHEYIADTARRLAHAGYLAIAPELFIRQGDAQSYGEMAKLIAEVVSKVPDAQVQGDLDATVQWAGQNGGDLTRVGITGFCWGGRQVWLYAAHSKHIKAGVAWYGRLVGQPSPLAPVNPVDLVGQLKGPVLGLYGGADPSIPPDTLARMQNELAGGSKAAKVSTLVLYPDTPHAFHADYRSSYREGPAKDGWVRMLAWLKAHGVA